MIILWVYFIIALVSKVVFIAAVIRWWKDRGRAPKGLWVYNNQTDSVPQFVPIEKLEKGKAQFLEPVSGKEKFKNAKNIEDLIEK